MRLILRLRRRRLRRWVLLLKKKRVIVPDLPKSERGLDARELKEVQARLKAKRLGFVAGSLDVIYELLAAWGYKYDEVKHVWVPEQNG